MFIGKYKLEGKEHFAIYYNSEVFHRETFSPNCKDIEVLALEVRGHDYQERKYDLVELAKDWQLRFSQYSWSYSELAEIEDWFYKNAKRYGLLEEFKVNGIC